MGNFTPTPVLGAVESSRGALSPRIVGSLLGLGVSAGPPARSGLQAGLRSGARGAGRGRRAGRGAFVRPERARERRAVAVTGRVHTASERGTMEARYMHSAEIEFICGPAPFTPVVRQTSYFDQQRVERQKGPRRPGPRRARGALGGSPPPSGRSRGDAASCTLTCLGGPRVGWVCFFCPCYQGRGVLFDPRAGRTWWSQGPLNPRRIPEGEGRADPRTGCSKDDAPAPRERGQAVRPAFPRHAAPGPAQDPGGRREARPLRSASPGLGPAREVRGRREAPRPGSCLSVSRK